MDSASQGDESLNQINEFLDETIANTDEFIESTSDVSSDIEAGLFVTEVQPSKRTL